MTNTRHRHIALIAAALIIAVFGANQWLAEPDASTPPPKPIAELPADHPWAPVRTPPPRLNEDWASASELKRLQDQVAALSSAVAALAAQPTPVPAPAAAHDGQPRGSSAQELIRQRADPGARAAAERQLQDAATERDAAFRREAANPQWAGSTALALQQALAGDGSAGALSARSVECRASSCRVEIADDGSDGIDDALSRFGARVAERLASMNVSRSGNGTIVLHLSR